MPPKKIVNVASVPQRSPFRYPGGKTWLVPALRVWLRSFPSSPATFVEPFAGGGIIALTVAFEELADRVLMVELDEQVAAVWKTVLDTEDAAWLASRIVNFELTGDSARAELARPASVLREVAFRTILKNRVCHGGIMAHGSGFIKLGENGKGIRSRWYAGTLRRRILDLARVRDRIDFIEGDGLEILRQFAGRNDAVFFIDPPYTAAGKKAGRRLYTHNELDHEELFRVTANLAGDFLMTYDNADGVAEMARRHGFDTEVIPMKNTHHAEMTELLVGRNLGWVRAMQTRQEPATLFD
jgi:DNA adenine methylase